MSMTCKFERSLLSHDEFETIRVTHHPDIYALDPSELRAVVVRLRAMRDKERTLARHRQREARNKGEPRGRSIPATPETPLQRKQIFAAAKKRVNKEIDRVRKLEARTSHVEAAHRALALRRSTNFKPARPTSDTSHSGMRPLPSTRRRLKVQPSKVGRVSQATKVAQAARDSRS